MLANHYQPLIEGPYNIPKSTSLAREVCLHRDRHFEIEPPLMLTELGKHATLYYLQSKLAVGTRMNCIEGLIRWIRNRPQEEQHAVLKFHIVCDVGLFTGDSHGFISVPEMPAIRIGIENSSRTIAIRSIWKHKEPEWEGLWGEFITPRTAIWDRTCQRLLKRKKLSEQTTFSGLDILDLLDDLLVKESLRYPRELCFELCESERSTMFKHLVYPRVEPIRYEWMKAYEHALQESIISIRWPYRHLVYSCSL